ncbi:MAG: P-loop NTPase [Candidatus Kapaibacterium sp.]|jgi:flagellar biosynthesis protein FlhG
MIQAKQPYLITIVSGKGGVGKSMITANIAYRLSELGKKVLAIDADIMCPNLHLLFGCNPNLRLDDWIYKRSSAVRIIHNIYENLDIIAGTAGNSNLDLQDYVSFIDLYQELLLNTDYDYILVDTAAGISKNLVEFCSFSNKISVVITDEPTSILDGYGLIKILQSYVDTAKIDLILNNIIDDEDAKDISNKINQATNHFLNLEFNILGVIPYNRAVRQSILRQEVLSKILPDIDVVQAINKIVTQLPN